MFILNALRYLGLLGSLVVVFVLVDAAENSTDLTGVGKAAEDGYVAEQDLRAHREVVATVATLQAVQDACSGFSVDETALRGFVIRLTRISDLSDFQGKGARFAAEVKASRDRATGSEGRAPGQPPRLCARARELASDRGGRWSGLVKGPAASGPPGAPDEG